MRYLYILTLLVLCSCSKDIDEVKIISFDIRNDIKEIQDAGIISDYRVVKLESNDSCGIIGQIDKIILFKDRIYIADFSNTLTVYIYDTTGNYINKINRRGRSRNEYTQLRSMFINQNDSTINLLSRNPTKILSFDLDGREIQTIQKLNKNLTDIKLSDNLYVGYSGNVSQDKSHNVWIFNKSGDFLSSCFEIPDGWESSIIGSGNNILSQSGYGLYYMSIMDYEIYKFNGINSFDINYKIDFGKYNWPENIKTYQQFHETRNLDYVTNVANYQEYENYWLFNFISSGQNLLGVYHKNTNISEVYKLNSNYDKYFISFGNIKCLGSDCIITAIDATEMKTYYEGKNEYNDFTEQYSTQIERLRNEISEVSEYGNPFLIIYDLK